MSRVRIAIIVIAGLAGLVPALAGAEPWLAVIEGQSCGTCHIAASGGGMRNTYGNVYSRSLLPAYTIGASNQDAFVWTGEIFDWLRLGANVRGGWREVDTPGRATVSDSDLERASVYLAIEPIRDRLMIYADQEFGQGTDFNREAWARWSFNPSWYLRAGRIFLPYGLRIEDDTAWIRQIPGINFTTPDRGAEIGLEKGAWSAQFAVSNGTAGGDEIDSGKQYSLNATYIQPGWRLGGSLNYNDSSFGDRELYSLYGGYRWKQVAWLAEISYVVDMGFPEGRRNQIATLVEANWRYRRGQNLKITYEHLDPDDTINNDQQNRYSLVWEYFPVQYLQLRAGLREYDGIPQSDVQNRSERFVQLHVFF